MAERWGDAVLRPRRPQGGETRYAATVVRRDLPLGRETLAWKTAAGGVIVTVLWLVRGQGGGKEFSFKAAIRFSTTAGCFALSVVAIRLPNRQSRVDGGPRRAPFEALADGPSGLERLQTVCRFK